MSNQINQFFGGPPLSVALRLVLLSILVGVILSAVGLDPLNLWRSLQNLVRQIWEMGFDAFWWLWRYFLLGAVLVIPIWLVVRVAKGARGRA
jgi:H+/Cl- antiporter ClcA